MVQECDANEADKRLSAGNKIIYKNPAIGGIKIKHYGTSKKW
jgi:hypothetical protein